MMTNKLLVNAFINVSNFQVGQIYNDKSSFDNEIGIRELAYAKI